VTYFTETIDARFACPQCGNDIADSLVINEDSVHCDMCNAGYSLLDCIGD